VVTNLTKSSSNLVNRLNQTEPATFSILPCWAFFRDSIFIYFSQDACPGNCSDEFENGSFQMKNYVTGAKNKKILLTLSWLVF
jgi:hypothetical protein